jgi:uncharacterized protein
MFAAYEVFKDDAGNYRFQLRAGNGRVVLVSRAFETRRRCLDGIASVRERSLDKQSFEGRLDDRGEHYFVLKSESSEIIGVSDRFGCEAEMGEGIWSVVWSGSTVKINELTS